MHFGVAHDVEVDEFFELEGGSFHVFEDVHEERGDVFAVGHVVDDAPDGFLLDFDVGVVELVLELSDFSGLFGSGGHAL